MRKLILFSVLFIIISGFFTVYACTVKDRDNYYDKCVVRLQCGEKQQCKLECLNEANAWYNRGCK